MQKLFFYTILTHFFLYIVGWIRWKNVFEKAYFGFNKSKQRKYIKSLVHCCKRFIHEMFLTGLCFRLQKLFSLPTKITLLKALQIYNSKGFKNVKFRESDFHVMIVAQQFCLLCEKGTVVAEAYTTQPNSKASSRVLYNIFESTCGG